VSEGTFCRIPIDVNDPPNRKPNGHLMLDSVRSILFSGRPDDAIPGELVELLGFDELELVSEILSNRSQFFKELRVINEPTPTPLLSNGREIGKLRSVTTKEAAHVIFPDPRSLAPDQARRRMEEQLQANAARPLFTGTAVSHAVLSDHVASYVKSRGVARSTKDLASCVHFSLKHGWRCCPFSIWE